MSDSHSDSSTVLAIINGAINLPGVKIDRDAFLMETLKVPSDKVALLLEKGPIGSGLFTQQQIRKVAESISSKRRLQTTSASAMAGLGGGLVMLASVPADTAQYFGFSLRLVQEIAYLYDHKGFFFNRRGNG